LTRVNWASSRVKKPVDEWSTVEGLELNEEERG